MRQFLQMSLKFGVWPVSDAQWLSYDTIRRHGQRDETLSRKFFNLYFVPDHAATQYDELLAKWLPSYLSVCPSGCTAMHCGFNSSWVSGKNSTRSRPSVRTRL